MDLHLLSGVPDSGYLYFSLCLPHFFFVNLKTSERAAELAQNDHSQAPG